MNSINNYNSNNFVNGVKSFLFLKNITECSFHDVVINIKNSVYASLIFNKKFYKNKSAITSINYML